MIEIDPRFGDGIVAVRQYGTVTDSDFADLAVKIAGSTTPDTLLLFMDWLGINRWEFTAPRAEALAAWRKAAKSLRRAAIIHDHRLIRQAAWLGAVLREQGVIVRSWPQYSEATETWLRAAQSASVRSTRRSKA